MLAHVDRFWRADKQDLNSGAHRRGATTAATTIAGGNFIFMDYESDRIHAITRILKLIQFR
jgi:hypothetical protein